MRAPVRSDDPAAGRNRPPHLIVLLVVIAAVLGAACGGDGRGGGDAADKTEGEDRASRDDGEAAPVTLSFQPTGKLFVHLPHLVASEKGYYADEKLTLDIKGDIFNASDASQVVASGGADVGLVGANGALNVIQAGRDLVTVAVPTRGSVVQITLAKKAVDSLAKSGVTPDSPIGERVKALKGLTLVTATAGSTIDLLSRTVMEEFGLNPDRDVTLQPLADPAGMTAALRGGTVDGLIFVSPTTVQPAVDGTGTLWIDTADPDIKSVSEIDFMHVITTKSFLGRQRDAVERYVRALSKGYKDVLDDKSETRALVKAKYFADMPDEVFQAAYESSLANFRGGLAPNKEGFEQLVKVFNRGRPEPASFQFEVVYDTDVVKAADDG